MTFAVVEPCKILVELHPLPIGNDSTELSARKINVMQIDLNGTIPVIIEWLVVHGGIMCVVS